MNFQVRHFMPGRVRLHVPELCRKRAVADSFVSWLRTQSGIKRARINYDGASLVVEYDVANHKFLEGMLRALKHTPLSEIRALLSLVQTGPDTAPSDAGAASAKPSIPVPWHVPLALPTLSLALAFSTNPIMMAVNLPLMLWNGFPIAARAWRVFRNESRLNIDVPTRSRFPPRSCKAIRSPVRS